jgi:hypothetical protein
MCSPNFYNCRPIRHKSSVPVLVSSDVLFFPNLTANIVKDFCIFVVIKNPKPYVLPHKPLKSSGLMGHY